MPNITRLEPSVITIPFLSECRGRYVKKIEHSGDIHDNSTNFETDALSLSMSPGFFSRKLDISEYRGVM